MNDFVNSFVLISVVQACFFAQVTHPSLTPSYENAHIKYINSLIMAKNKTEYPFVDDPHKEAERLLKENPANALMPQHKLLEHSSPLYKAISHGNKYITHCIFKLPICLTQKQKYDALKKAIETFDKPLDLARDLMAQYQIPIMLPEDDDTITCSLFNSLFFRATWYTKPSQYVIIAPEEKELTVVCLKHILSTAKKSLTLEQFFEFTSYHTFICPFAALTSNTFIFSVDPEFCFRIRSCLITHGVICSNTQECRKEHPEIARWFYMKQLEHDTKYMDIT
jgi:hypothetical protein